MGGTFRHTGGKCDTLVTLIGAVELDNLRPVLADASWQAFVNGFRLKELCVSSLVRG